MTLINAYLIGGKTCVLTSDTRQVMTAFGKTIKIGNAKSKITKISENIIGSGGGYTPISDFINAKMVKDKPSTKMDCYVILIQAAREIQVKFKSELNNGDTVAQYVVMGFEPGTKKNWMVKYVLGEALEVWQTNPREGEVDGIIFSPSNEHLDVAFDALGPLSGFSNPKDYESVTLELVEYLSTLQKYMNKIDPDMISEEFCYHAVRWDEDTKKHVHYSDKINLNETEMA